MKKDELLEKILDNKDVWDVPIIFQSIMIHAFEQILESEGVFDDVPTELSTDGE